MLPNFACFIVSGLRDMVIGFVGFPIPTLPWVCGRGPGPPPRGP